MSGFGFSEEQEMFRQMVRRFAARELQPGAKERAKQDGYPRGLIKKLARNGLIGLRISPEYGGQGGDWVTLGIAAEELSKVDSMAGLLPVMPAVTALAMEQGSPEELRQEWLPKIAGGDVVVSLALTEPGCGSDAAAIKTTAVRDGDHYVLNGEKTSITSGAFTDLCLVYAKTDPTAGARGVTCFLVPMDLPGLTRVPFVDMGWKPLTRGSLFMDNVRLPARYRVDEEGKGFYLVMSQFDFVRVCLALQTLGMAQASIDEAIAYAKERTAFGRPIAKFEGVSFKIAEHVTRIEAARLLCYRTMWMKDQGMHHTKESAMCKWLCPVVAVNAIHDALIIHGHVAYSEEYPIEQRLRDCIGFEIADGTADVMKIVIARELLGREYLPYR